RAEGSDGILGQGLIVQRGLRDLLALVVENLEVDERARVAGRPHVLEEGHVLAWREVRWRDPVGHQLDRWARRDRGRRRSAGAGIGVEAGHRRQIDAHLVAGMIVEQRPRPGASVALIMKVPEALERVGVWAAVKLAKDDR